MWLGGRQGWEQSVCWQAARHRHGPPGSCLGWDRDLAESRYAPISAPRVSKIRVLPSGAIHLFNYRRSTRINSGL